MYNVAFISYVLHIRTILYLERSFFGQLMYPLSLNFGRCAIKKSLLVIQVQGLFYLVNWMNIRKNFRGGNFQSK